MKQVKEKEFHSQLNMTETEKKSNGWYYRGRKILEKKNEQEKVLKDNHDSSITGHSRFKKTL